MNYQAKVTVRSSSEQATAAILEAPLSWFPKQTISKLQTHLPIRIGSEWSLPDGNAYRLTEFAPPLTATFIIQNKFVEKHYTYTIQSEEGKSQITLSLHMYFVNAFHRILVLLASRIFSNLEQRGLEKILRSLKNRMENE